MLGLISLVGYWKSAVQHGGVTQCGLTRKTQGVDFTLGKGG